MTAIRNPALEAFVASIDQELAMAQVVILRRNVGYELCHVEDRHRRPELLRELRPEEVRSLVQFTTAGAFRPLKSAPNLQTGWRVRVDDDAELERVLNQFYPGAIADWFASQSPAPPITHYREFTGRQTGMYRITSMLGDAQVPPVARACCHKRFCLKRRLWTADGLASDSAGEKSLIPCLEPCAVLLEFARKAMRIEQEDKLDLPLSAGEIGAITVALEISLAQPDPAVREADFNAPANPRRLQLVLEKLATLPKPLKLDAEE